MDRHGTPQPRPVWFHWDGRTALIFSQPAAAKVRHLRHRRRVAVHLNTDEAGGQVAVLTGEAKMLREAPAAARVRAYLRKYREGLKDLGMSAERFRADYTVPILFTPRQLRGF